MSSEIAIKVENLSKCYQIYDTPRDRLKQFVLPRAKHMLGLQPRQYFQEFWALKNIGFEVRKGETVGIIGRNGSGKSTLLQIICGTLSATSGCITTYGRIAALLELGSGFNPEFTGRENVYMNAALLGLSKSETDACFDDIAAFADIGEFIEQPVKTYSSGMFVRLAFAVNIISSPDIMIIDEALAVGDMSFQAKCMTALTRFQENGGTVLFVSHDIGTVKSICQQAIYLEHGQIISSGPAPDVAEYYIRIMREEMNAESQKHIRTSMSMETEKNSITTGVDGKKQKTTIPHDLKPVSSISFKTSDDFDRQAAVFRYGLGHAIVRYVELLDIDENPVIVANFNQQVTVRIHFEVKEDTEVTANYYILDDKKNLIAGAGFLTVGETLLKCRSGERYIVNYQTRLPLQEGNYTIQVQLTNPVIPDESADFLDVIDDAVIFSMSRRTPGRIWAKVYLENKLRIISA